MTESLHARSVAVGWRRWLLRVATGVTYCLLIPSCVIVGGGSFGLAFHTTFAIENGSDQTISVTPVGTVGPEGWRSPLPTCRNLGFSFPVAMRGGYHLRPGESVDVTYDMDDINLSEIVVMIAGKPVGQHVVDSQPTQRQYHRPLETHFRINLAELSPVPPDVLSAANAAQAPTRLPWIMAAIMILPWMAVGLLSWAERCYVRVVPST